MGIMGIIICPFCKIKNRHDDEVPLYCRGCGAIFHGFDDGGWEKGEFQKWAEKEFPVKSDSTQSSESGECLK